MKKLFPLLSVIAFLILLGCVPKKNETVTLDIVGEALPPLSSLEELATEYTEKTGIIVKVHPFEFETALQRAQLDFSSGSGEYEIVMGIFYNHGRYTESGYIVPFTDPKFSNLVELETPDSAFYPALQETVMNYKNSRVAYPFSAQTMFLWFRKDLFENLEERASFLKQYGYALPIPDETNPLTWTEYYDISEFFTRSSDEEVGGTSRTSPFYGTALQMKRHPASFYEFTNFVYSFGGSFFGENGEQKINTAENLEALNYYLSLRKYAPPNYLQATWDDALAQMQQGNVAMTIMWSDAPSELYNEEASVVSGKVGYSLVPIKKTIGRKVAVFGGWGFMINADGKHQDEAYKFIQWVNQPEQQLSWAKMGGLPGASSIFKDPEYISIPYMKAQNEALKNVVSWPKDPKAEQFVNIGIEILSKAVSDQIEPEQALLEFETRVVDLYK